MQYNLRLKLWNFNHFLVLILFYPKIRTKMLNILYQFSLYSLTKLPTKRFLFIWQAWYSSPNMPCPCYIVRGVKTSPAKNLKNRKKEYP